MQQNDETRFEDFVGLISGLYKEIQRIKTSEGRGSRRYVCHERE